MLKLQLKKIFTFFNLLLGRLLPKVDYRKNKQHFLGYHIIAGPEIIKSINFSYKIISDEEPYWLALFEKGINFPGVFYIHFPTCYLIGRGLILDQEKKIILESTLSQREYLNKLLKNHLVLKTFFVEPKLHWQNIIPLINKLSNNYYHWTIESLARLALLTKDNPENFTKLSILIAKDSPEFVKQSIIALFKYPENRIMYFGNDDVVKLDNCFLPGNSFIRTKETAMTYIYSPSIYKLLNKISLQNVPDENTTPAYVIVSRKKSVERRLIHEEKIIAAFPETIFKIVYTEEMNFQTQVNIFRHAKIIISPHGAALANLVYVNNNPLVIEIFPSQRNIRDASLFYQIANALNITYRLIIKAPINERLDMEVDENLVLQLQDLILQHNCYSTFDASKNEKAFPYN